MIIEELGEKLVNYLVFRIDLFWIEQSLIVIIKERIKSRIHRIVIYHQGFSYINLIDVDRSGGVEGVGIYKVSVV